MAAETDTSQSNKRKSKHPGGGFGTSCRSYGCFNYSGNTEGIKFFTFPREKARCDRWLQNIRRQDMMGMKPENLKYARLCSDHFEDSQFMNPRDRTSRLKPKAVPTIINAPNPPKRLKSSRREIVRVIQNDEEVTTAVKNEDIIPVPTETGTMTDISKQDIDALKATIHQLKAENHRLRKKCTEKRTVSKIILLDTLKEYLSPPAYNFVKQQIEVAKNAKNGVRWSDDIKLFALQMKGISTKGYKFLKKIFRLPAIRTLNKPLKSYDIIEGFHQPVVKTLEEITTTMSPKEKLVVLSNDEIALKET